VRRAVFEGCDVALVEPDGSADAVTAWRFLATVLVADGTVDVVIARRAAELSGLRHGLAMAAGVRATRGAGALTALAGAYRDAVLEAAGRELDALESGGWASIIGDLLESAAGEPRTGVAFRTDGFDPLG